MSLVCGCEIGYDYIYSGFFAGTPEQRKEWSIQMKKRSVSMLALLGAVACTAGLMAGCSMQDDGLGQYDESKVVFRQLEPMKDGEEIAVVQTTYGEMRLRFFPEEAPNAVANFKALAQEGFYNGKEIFNIQKVTEDETSDEILNVAYVTGAEDRDGVKGAVASSVNNGKPFNKELSYNVYPFPGAVAAYSDKNTCDSRFFVVGDVPITDAVREGMNKSQFPQLIQDKFEEVGGVPSLTQSYSVFAQIYEGLDVSEKILNVPTDTEGRPTESVAILSVTFESYDPQQASQAESE